MPPGGRRGGPFSKTIFVPTLAALTCTEQLLCCLIRILGGGQGLGFGDVGPGGKGGRVAFAQVLPTLTCAIGLLCMVFCISG